MRLAPLLAIFACSCAADERPPGGGGGGGGGGGIGSPDAELPVIDGGMAGISGRLCLIDDLRNPEDCTATSGLADISIEISGGASTLSRDNGSFTLPSPGGSIADLQIAFGDDGFRDALIPIGLADGSAEDLLIPLVPETVWESLLVTVGVLEPDATSSIAAYFVDAQGDPVPNAEVIVPSGTIEPPLYDGPSGPEDWLAGGLTGASGAVLMIGVPSIEPEVSFIVSRMADIQSVGGVPVQPNVLTFVTVALP